MNIIQVLAQEFARERLKLPSADLAEVAAQAALYTADGAPLTVDQIQAADNAIIDYVLGRIAKQLSPRSHAAAPQTRAQQVVVSPIAVDTAQANPETSAPEVDGDTHPPLPQGNF